MKLINYNYGYNQVFMCSIHGHIVMSEKEWKNVEKYIFNPSVIKKIQQSSQQFSEGYLKRTLEHDITRTEKTRNGRLFNVRVSATEIIVSKYGLKNYKKGNYAILITK